LLQAAEEATDEEIADALRVGVSTVHRTRQRFVEAGVAEALTERSRCGCGRKLDGKQEAFLVALACSTPPSGRDRWTMQLLADRLVQLKLIEQVSDETVRRILKKTTSSRGREKNGAFPASVPNSSGTWRMCWTSMLSPTTSGVRKSVLTKVQCN
jgi:transposase